MARQTLLPGHHPLPGAHGSCVEALAAVRPTDPSSAESHHAAITQSGLHSIGNAFDRYDNGF
ncbi:hypothetical protein [Streptomyces sp. NPDC001816]|uniref:hypothetical protein n=1 Tax=Streptomyces sp. NPDC001816 TaxID=3364612 RepID=UPI0036A39ADF